MERLIQKGLLRRSQQSFPRSRSPRSSATTGYRADFDLDTDFYPLGSCTMSTTAPTTDGSPASRFTRAQHQTESALGASRADGYSILSVLQPPREHPASAAGHDWQLFYSHASTPITAAKGLARHRFMAPIPPRTSTIAGETVRARLGREGVRPEPPLQGHNDAGLPGARHPEHARAPSTRTSRSPPSFHSAPLSTTTPALSTVIGTPAASASIFVHVDLHSSFFAATAAVFGPVPAIDLRASSLPTAPFRLVRTSPRSGRSRLRPRLEQPSRSDGCTDFQVDFQRVHALLRVRPQASVGRPPGL